MTTAGWFGKIPALGDFASYRLPQEFVDAWDLWLQHGMAASRASLGARWLESYLTAPIWYFSLFPEVVGPQAWTGLMMPSVDKVGRHFPLTIAVPLDSDGEAVVGMFARQTWYAALGDIALATLNLDFPVKQLEADLDALRFPSVDQSAAASRGLADWWLGDVPEAMCVFEAPAPAGDALADAGRCLLAATGRGRSLWWRQSEDGWPQVMHGFRGLPPEAYFERLVDAT
jgi:type VI secretion system protein ImpM